MPQNLNGMTATGSYSDASTADITNTVAWSVSDTTVVTINSSTGILTLQNAGKIYGGTVGVTATLSPGTPGTASLIIVPSDSSSMAPRMPQSNEQWQALGISPWGGWWGCQEALGDLVGSGSVPFTLTGQGSVIYRDSFTDWTRAGLSIGNNAASNNQGWSAPAGTGPNIQTTSVALIGYFKLKTPGGLRQMFGFHQNPGTIQQIAFQQQITGIPRLIVSGTQTSFTLNHEDGRFHPFLLVLDRTNSRAKGYTDLEKVTGSFPGTAFFDCIKGFGGIIGVTQPSGSMVWAAYCTGSVAERYSEDGAASDLLKRLGWTNTTW